MQTIKTGVVVALLLAVCYGAFVALNAPEPELPDSIREWASAEGELDSLVDLDLGLEIPGEQIAASDLTSAGGSPPSQNMAAANSNPMLQGQTTSQGAVSLPANPAASLASGSALPQIPPLSGSLSSPGSANTSPGMDSSLAAGSSSKVPGLSTGNTGAAANSTAANANSLATSLSLPVTNNTATTNTAANNTSGFPALSNPNLNTPNLPASSTAGSTANNSALASNSIPPLNLPNLEVPTSDIQAAMNDLASNSQAAITQAQQSLQNSAATAQNKLTNQIQGAVNQLASATSEAKTTGQNLAQQALEDAKQMQATLAGNTESLIPDAVDSVTAEAGSALGNLASQIADSGQKVQATLAGVKETKTPSGALVPTAKFAVAREQALAKANRGELKEALTLLTPYFGSPELGYEETADLVDILDALSREVVYSQRHLIEPPHIVRPTDTVASVSEQYNITPELLTALNGLGDSKALVPGSKLKVLQGPVNAHVSLQRQELTLFVGSLYAGRFPVSFGKDPEPKAGVFEVVDRQTKRTYYGLGANVLRPDDPRNPYGGFWINLGDDLCVHGTAEMASSELKDAGCISLAPLDAKHVYSILNRGSQVTVSE